MTGLNAQTLDWEKSGGLIPAVVQDADTRQMLMLGYMNREALATTLDTGRVTFWSRSKGRLWMKGESSGAVLDLVSITADCDGDALLVEAHPAGPGCHLGTPSCFGDADAPGIGFLARVEQVVESRRGGDPEASHVTRLLAGGPLKAAQKVGEEGVEAALAGAAQDDSALLEESADLIFHLIVLLRARGLGLAEAIEVLRSRRTG